MKIWPVSLSKADRHFLSQGRFNTTFTFNHLSKEIYKRGEQ